MYKIGVIGDSESVIGFRAVGLDVFPCEDPAEAARLIRELAEGEYAIIYIMEGLAAQVEKEIDKYKDSRLPAIIPIPNKEGASGNGMRNVREAVKRAVGADILFGGNDK
ncbi:V-type ATP synthase subunit F [Aminicella lysinilytica]|uniref:V/A-type H+-transporting ATPase subunit F n=1 Tax=Aminicella lysinilytica TaxID=433323 RepID=A0A4R6QBI6_9FIRM|nr:V-type ATP synthase subunit F [Aminicella lysinilytica]NLD10200.1 V-type ATP synthase subunit F [Clostridiales bacterium]TDP59625.1 V/A-type H+-transporting ATPase subunit F [Aminicella lysinilytica]